MPEKPELRFEFVGMMFAVTAGEIGLKAGQLASADALHGPKCLYVLPAVLHLLVAALIVAASWVGWSRSTTSLAIRDVTEVLSWPFAVLFLDVLLVIVYFMLVDTVEITVSDNKLFIDPNSKKESFWIFMIFIGYFAWDFLTKAVITDGQGDTVPCFCKRAVGTRFWSRAWASATCMTLGGIAWWRFHELTSYWRVVLADVALLLLVLLFRGLKEFSSALGRRANEKEDEFRTRRAQTWKKPAIWSFICLSGLLACTACATAAFVSEAHPWR